MRERKLRSVNNYRIHGYEVDVNRTVDIFAGGSAVGSGINRLFHRLQPTMHLKGKTHVVRLAGGADR